MLVIRFLRIGRKNQPSFRIVVTEKRTPPKGGKFLEILGSYNPLTKEKRLRPERIKYWLSVGAKLSPSVHNLLIEEKIIEGKKIASHKLPKKETSPASRVKAPTEAPIAREEEKEKMGESEKESKEKPEGEEKPAP